MCHTPWCFGDCDECIAEAKFEADCKASQTCRFDPEESVLESECGLKATSVKQDTCNKCGYVYNYP